MALQACPSLWIPRPIGLTGSATYSDAFTVDASGEKGGFIFRVPATGTLKKVAFRTRSVVQNQTIRVSFQDVDLATGYPDGTADQWRNISIADTDDNVPKETGILSSDGTDGGAKRSVTRGDWLAVVFEHNPFNAGDVFRAAAINTGNDACGLAFPVNYATAWAKTYEIPILTLLYDDDGSDKCYPLAEILPFTQDFSNALSFNSGSANPKKGLKFRFPFPCKISGAMMKMLVTSGASFDVKLYGPDGQTVLQSANVPGGVPQPSSHRYFHVKLGEQVLSKDTFYYLLVEPTTGSNVQLWYADVPAGKEIYLDQADGGAAFHYAERSTEAPTATTTRRPLIHLEVTALDDGVGAGGGAAMPAVISY